jgi:hypothetical protein
MIAMSGATVLGSQLKELLSGLSDHGHRHLSEAEKDLVQTTVLLGEAIEKLGASFMGIHQAVCRQQHEIDELLARHPESQEAAERLRAIQGEIDAHVNAAVTGLQFQDMTGQLIERTLRRVGGILAALDTLGASGLAGLQGHDSTEISALLASINHALSAQNAKMQALSQKSVSQTHMNSGDIELF